MATTTTDSNDEITLQTVLIISTVSSGSIKELIGKILDTDESAVRQARFDGKTIRYHQMPIETKYYSSTIHLVEMPTADLVSQSFANTVQGVVIHFDPDREGSFEQVKSWLPFLDEFVPEIRILVCDRATETTKIRRDDVQRWCIEQCFELVETDPAPEDSSESTHVQPAGITDDDDDEESLQNDFPETTGIKRIVQALHAHIWPEMEMKDRPNYKPSERFQQLLREEIGYPGSSGDVASNGTLPETSPNSSSENGGNPVPPGGLTLENINSFETLFGNLMDMKEKASHLSGDARKEYAEQVAMAFWKAMDGDEDDA